VDPKAHDEFHLPKWLQFGLSLLVLLGSIAPFVSSPSGVDAGYHLTWIREFVSLASNGVWMPRWIPDAYHGFGSAAFYLYPPLSYYLAFGFYELTGSMDAVLLFQLTGFLATIVSFFAARSLLHAIGSSSSRSLVGAVIYTFAPYRIAELYSRSSLSSHLGYAFLPLVWLGLVYLHSADHTRQNKGLLLFSVASSLLLLSNIALAIVTALSAIVVALVIPKHILRNVALKAALGSLLTVGLTAFYLSSVLGFSSEVQLAHLIDVREYFWEDLLHLRNLPGIIHLGLLYFAVFFLSYGYWKAVRNGIVLSFLERTVLKAGILLSSLIATIELPYLGFFFLTKAPLLQMVQGTWRFYIDTVLFVAIGVGVVRSRVLEQCVVNVLSLWVTFSIFLLLLVVFQIHLFAHASPPTTDPYTFAPRCTMIDPIRLDTILRAHQSDPMATFQSTNRTDLVKIQGRSEVAEVYQVQLQQQTQVTFHRFFWSAWHLYYHGIEIRAQPDLIGRATADLPAGTYLALWKLERSPLERTGIWLSVLTVSGIIGIITFGSIRSKLMRRARF
jgi:hypothetical protein